MTKKQTRLFFFVSTAFFFVVFGALTVQTHAAVPELTHEDQLTAQALAGKRVWEAKDCTNCHTLMGEGAYYAPDLTKIAKQRGPSYLSKFLKNPSAFYSEEKDRRLMPNLKLSDEQIANLVAFLTWISDVDTQGWPPRPIIVSGAAVPAAFGEQKQVSASEDPVALGEALFRTTPPGCAGCHSTVRGVTMVGPSLAGIADRAASTIKSPEYKGNARDAAAYIRESILTPDAYLVAGPTFSAQGHSVMPDYFSRMLTPEQLDQLTAYLVSLK